MTSESTHIKIAKSRNDNNSNDYFNFLGDKVSKNLQLSKKMDKIDGELESIPDFNEYEVLLKYNYSINYLAELIAMLEFV
jgi:hypothetical protein